jgi:hypothetical protein
MRALSVRESDQVVTPAPEITAAYSLDPLIAEAQVTEGSVRIWGRAPGHATVVAVHARDFSTIAIDVTVTPAPPVLPDVPWSGLDSEDRNANGYYDLRVSSDPMQVSQTFDYRTGWMQAHVSNVAMPGITLPGTSSVRFPFSYVRLLGTGWKATLLDQNVDSSPLSVSGTLVRGLHFSAGEFAFDGGYTSVAGFQSLFLPAFRQLIFGTSWTHRLTDTSQVGATAYFLQRTSSVPGHRGPALATLFYKKHTQASDFLAEAGVSDGVAGAITATHNTDRDQFFVTARYRPKYYATSSTDNLNGLRSEAHWDRRLGQRFTSGLSASRSDIYMLSGKQSIEISSEALAFKASRYVSLSSGVSFSRLADAHATFPEVKRVAVPVGLTYDRTHFGAGFQYEYSRTSRAFSAGQGFRGSARWSRDRLQLSATGGLSTQSLGVDSVYSNFPGLTVALAQLGLDASSNVEKLATFLKDRAFLSSLGIAPDATLRLVPRAWQSNVSASWRTRRQVLELDSNYNIQSFLSQQSIIALETARYRRGIGKGNEIMSSLTLFDTFAPSPRKTLVWEFGVRHDLGADPLRRYRERGGDISGTVRLEDENGVTTAEGVEIRLDGQRHTATDSNGHYRFADVASGYHTVQIAFQSNRSFWYSTPSRMSAKANSVVDFGIIYPSAQIVGYVLDDAGRPLPNLGISIKGGSHDTSAASDQQGRFVVPVTRSGTYVVAVNAETVPDGYAVGELAPITVSVEEGQTKKIGFSLGAIRALSGVVKRYDSTREQYVPVPGVHVRIPELNRQVITDAGGHYLFREMPSGWFTILVNDEDYGHVQLSPAPQLLRHDIQLRPSSRTPLLAATPQ